MSILAYGGRVSVVFFSDGQDAVVVQGKVSELRHVLYIVFALGFGKVAHL